MALTQKELRALILYDPATGIFTWLAARRPRIVAGDRAGNIHNKGYREICINQTSYLEHRLAWFYMTGSWPGRLIDHKDRDKSNNAWANLREADYSQNRANSAYKKSGLTSTLKGVHWRSDIGKWTSQITVNQKTETLGVFLSETDAQKAYAEAHAAYFKEFSDA